MHIMCNSTKITKNEIIMCYECKDYKNDKRFQHTHYTKTTQKLFDKLFLIR